jgi:segregation and condensation protein A
MGTGTTVEDHDKTKLSQEQSTSEGSRPGAQETEVESLLGPDVKTPHGIPRDYKPLESSTHGLFHIELADFAGPLDLLLYLIKKHDLDIFDIPIKFITDRYLEMLGALGDLPIDIAAEFLVLASELTHIKSKMLLPTHEGVAVEQDDGPELDPREELVKRLLEYQKYRDAAGQLSDRDQLGRDVFARIAAPSDDELDMGLKAVSVFRLVELMATLVKKQEGHHEIALDPVSIVERIEYVIAFGEAREGRFMLTHLLQGLMTRTELVVTFIAVLEMTRLGLLKLYEEVRPPPSPEELAFKRDELDLALAPEEGAANEAEPERNPDREAPGIWIHLTGKQMSGEVRDDYR